MRRTFALTVVLAALLGGCTGTPAAAPSSARSWSGSPSAASPSSDVADSQTLTCGNSIDGSAPPADLEVVLGAVALPTSPGSRALQAADIGGEAGVPALFAKTGIVVRAGVAAELEVDVPAGERAGIGWGGEPSHPSQRFAVPACPDARGTGWLAFPGGYWVDRPGCLPLVVRAGGQEQRVRVGVGRACPGQQPPVVP